MSTHPPSKLSPGRVYFEHNQTRDCSAISDIHLVNPRQPAITPRPRKQNMDHTRPVKCLLTASKYKSISLMQGTPLANVADVVGHVFSVYSSHYDSLGMLGVCALIKMQWWWKHAFFCYRIHSDLDSKADKCFLSEPCGCLSDFADASSHYKLHWCSSAELVCNFLLKFLIDRVHFFWRYHSCKNQNWWW